jgi:chaperonin GroES
MWHCTDRNLRAEGVSDQMDLAVWGTRGSKVRHCGLEVGESIADPARLTSEVKAQGATAECVERPEHRVDHEVVSIATESRVGVADDRRRPGSIGDVSGQREPVGRHEVQMGHTGTVPCARMADADDKLPIKMLNDRLLVRLSKEDGERTSTGGILIPATAQMAKRLIWGEVVALGQNVRSAEAGDKVLFSPDDRYEVEVQGTEYIMLRERDLHAVAAERIESSTGLYL